MREHVWCQGMRVLEAGKLHLEGCQAGVLRHCSAGLCADGDLSKTPCPLGLVWLTRLHDARRRGCLERALQVVYSMQGAGPRPAQPVEPRRAAAVAGMSAMLVPKQMQTQRTSMEPDEKAQGTRR